MIVLQHKQNGKYSFAIPEYPVMKDSYLEEMQGKWAMIHKQQRDEHFEEIKEYTSSQEFENQDYLPFRVCCSIAQRNSTRLNVVQQGTTRPSQMPHIVQENNRRMLRHGKQLFHPRVAPQPIVQPPHELLLIPPSRSHLVVHLAVPHEQEERVLHKPPNPLCVYHSLLADVLPAPPHQLLQALSVHNSARPQSTLHSKQRAAEHQVVLTVDGRRRLRSSSRVQAGPEDVLDGELDGGKGAPVLLHVANDRAEPGVFDEVDVGGMTLGIDAEPAPRREVAGMPVPPRPNVVKELFVCRELDDALVLLA